MVEGNERAAALEALCQDQRKRLAAYARFKSQGSGEDGDDLLQEAFARWMSSDKPVESQEQTCNFLRGAINSIVSNIFRHDKVVRRVEGVRAVAQEGDDEDPVEQAGDPTASTEGPTFAQQMYDLCGHDPEVQSLLTANAIGSTPDEIKSEFGWDDKKYNAVQKRKRRLVMRWMLEGKLQ
jgi:DNA-directed RNA polymerase specialized sigma24 family protein